MPSPLTLEARALRTHIDLFIEQIAGHLLTDPTRKLQLLALVLEFNLRDHHAFEDAAINVDVPNRTSAVDPPGRCCGIKTAEAGCYTIDLHHWLW